MTRKQVDRDSQGYARRLTGYRRGRNAELIAALLYRLRGHRVLARRYRTPVGELDLIVAKGRRVRFVEVKSRATRAECETAVTPETRRRVRRAAEAWLSHNAGYQDHDLGFDVVFVVPWRFPVTLRDAL